MIVAGFYVPGYWCNEAMLSMAYEALTDVTYVGVDLNTGLVWYLERMPWGRFVGGQSAEKAGGA